MLTFVTNYPDWDQRENHTSAPRERTSPGVSKTVFTLALGRTCGVPVGQGALKRQACADRSVATVEKPEILLMRVMGRLSLFCLSRRIEGAFSVRT